MRQVPTAPPVPWLIHSQVLRVVAGLPVSIKNSAAEPPDEAIVLLTFTVVQLVPPLVLCAIGLASCPGETR